MRRMLLAFMLFGCIATGITWLSCGHDDTIVQSDSLLPVESDEGAAIFEWAIGPIEGITTAWHPAPPEITIPTGTTLHLKCGGAQSAIQWDNAREISHGTFGSIAECRMDRPGRYEIRASVVSAGGGGTGKKGDDGIHAVSSSHSCVVNVVDAAIDGVGVVALQPRVAPLTLSESSSNYETMKAFLTGGEHNQQISQLRRVGLNHYRTAVNRYVALGATLTDGRFGSLIETRVSGERPVLGTESLHLAKPGHYTVSVGPPAKAKSFEIDTYKVTITSHEKGRDFVTDGEPVTFVAQTDPPGYEDEITWISSTKFGVAQPVVGHGATFTVVFQSALGRDSWFGVRADNAVFTEDAVSISQCVGPVIVKTQKYSRGNNDCDEMQEQKALTGSYVYESGMFELTVFVAPNFCLCSSNTCSGSMRISSDLTLRLTYPEKGTPAGFSLIGGNPPSQPTTDNGGGPPGPNVTVKVEPTNLDFSFAENKFQKVGGDNAVWRAQAVRMVSCGAGAHRARFYVVRDAFAGAGGVTPGTTFKPAFFIDVNVTIAELDCVLTPIVKVFLTEFVPGWDFDHGGETPGASAELPQVTIPGDARNNRNIVKLIEEDGVPVDNPYPPKGVIFFLRELLACPCCPGQWGGPVEG